MPLAFWIFVAIFCGGLAALTMSMGWIAAILARRNREDAKVGLCARCVHAREVRSSRGSVFFLCGLSEVDPAYPKYPRLPVIRCAGFRAGHV